MGGIDGALIMALVFDWALIIVSSLVGAALISCDLSASDTSRTLILIGLAIAGIIIQYAWAPASHRHLQF